MYKIVFSIVAWLNIFGRVLLAQDFIWENIGAESRDFRTVLVSPQDSKIIFAGQSGNLLKSDNGGKDWRRILVIRGRMHNINDLAINKDNSNQVYAATDNGLYRSNNFGVHWARIFRGKNNPENQCTAIGIGAQLILVGTKAGLFISRDNGRSWYKQEMGLGGKGIYNIDFGYGDKTIIYLAAENGIFKSLDNGQSWENIFVRFTGQSFGEELVIQEDENLVVKENNNLFIKADKNNINLLYLAGTKGVYKTLDQGQSWEKLTEYGLLNPEVKLLLLSDKLGILALTVSGVFIFQNERWQELSNGLTAGRFNFVTLDQLGNIYLGAENGLFRSNQSKVNNLSGSSFIEDYFKYEPNIRQVQEAAIKYAEVSPEKISQWRKAVIKKAFFPQINIGLDRNSTDLWHWEGGSTTKNDDDSLRRGKDNIDWDVSLSWDLGDLIWNEAQASIDVRSKLMVELRDDILDQVNKLYFERIRVKSELDNLAIEDRYKRFQKQLKLEELAASLDALTRGYYSEQLRLLATRQS